MDQNIDRYLRSIYYDPEEPGSFGGVNSLYNRVKKDNTHNIGKQRVRKWLAAQDTYSLFRPAVYKFQKRRIMSAKKNYLWEIDLLDMDKYKKENEGYKFILFAIDTFTRKLHTRPLRSKKNDEVADALQDVFKLEKPLYIRSDRGMEFRGGHTQKLFQKEGIRYYTTANLSKAAVVERVIKNIKLRATRMMKAANNHRWLDDLRDLTKSYNQSYHSTIRMSPNEATKADQDKLFEIIYAPKTNKNRYRMKVKVSKDPKKDRSIVNVYKYKIGQKVRLSKIPQLFDREYKSKWTVEVFTITDRIYEGGVPMYTVKDQRGENIEGRFYQQELQAVIEEKDKLYNIEKILSYKTVKGPRGTKRKMALVKWEDYPRIFNSWVNTTDIKDIESLKIRKQ